MISRLILLCIVTCFWSIRAAEDNSAATAKLVDALTITSWAKEAVTQEEFFEASKLVGAFLGSEEGKRLRIPDAAQRWIPHGGPCDPRPLEIAFVSSLAKDHILRTQRGSIHRAWLAAIRVYRMVRAVPQNEFPSIPAVEEMIIKETKGTLSREASEIEQAEVASKK